MRLKKRLRKSLHQLSLKNREGGNEMSQETLLPESLQLRLMDMEYSTVTVEEVQQIYFEETGKEPPFDIAVYHSEDYVDEEKANGFNGTIVHIENGQGVNEAYTIARGTQDFTDDDWHATDWSYNIMGIFVGQNKTQYDAAESFDDEVTKEISEKTSTEPKKIALGHSLGGNLVTLMQLTFGRFDEVYTVNAAPPSFYQLANIDKDFREEIEKKYNINLENSNELYNFNSDELQEFAEEYYESRGEDIQHLTSEQDIMTALFNIRGFFQVGDPPTTVDAFPDEDEDVESLAALFDEIPDEFVKDVQMYFAKNFKDTYNEEGFQGLFKELTGIDSRLIDKFFNQGEELGFFKTGKHVLDALNEAEEKIPELTRLLEGLAESVPAVLDTLVKHEYLTKAESKVVHEEYMNILSHVQDIEKMLEEGINLTQGDGGLQIMNILKHFQEILNSVDTIDENTEKLQEHLGFGVTAHELSTIIKKLLADTDISYEKNDGTLDMIMSKNVDGKNIKINISSALRIYTEGLSILESKETVLSEIESKYERAYVQDYENRERRVMKKVREMEESPYSYQDLMGNFTRDTKVFHKVTKIDVHEDIPNLPENLENIYEGTFTYIKGVIEKEKVLLTNIKDSIEELFEEDERISKEIFGEKEG